VRPEDLPVEADDRLRRLDHRLLGLLSGLVWLLKLGLVLRIVES
jgi:hypothetical protein